MAAPCPQCGGEVETFTPQALFQELSPDKVTRTRRCPLCGFFEKEEIQSEADQDP